MGFFLLALVLAFPPGCSPISYRPDENRVKELGPEKARTELKETVLRAKATGGGAITAVDVTDDALKVKSQQSTLGVFYQMETRQLENEVYFPVVEKVDLYSNNWAYVYTSGGKLSLQVLLASPEDAQRFADLVMSFRANRSAGG